MAKWTSLLPSNATELDLAIDYAQHVEFLPFDQDLTKLLDPYHTPEGFLPWVAWGRGTQLWEEGWADSTKREWAGEQYRFQARRGTQYALERALRTMGFDLVQYVTAPQGFYASPALPKRYWDDWIRQMPEIRIYLGSEEGLARGDELYAEDGFVGVHAAGRDDGWLYHGRKAVMRQRGVVTPLKTYQWSTDIEERQAFTIDRVSTPGECRLGFIAGEDFVGDAKFIGFCEVTPQLLTIRLDQQYRHTESNLQLSTVVPSMEPLDVTYERNSDTAPADPFLFADDGVWAECFVERDKASQLIADRVYLHDPSVAVPMTEGISFSDVTRMGIESHTAEVLIDLHMKDNLPSFYVEGYIGEMFAIAEDRTYSDQAFRAIQAAKAYDDRILVSFEVIRPLTVQDPITESTKVGDWVRNSL